MGYLALVKTRAAHTSRIVVRFNVYATRIWKHVSLGMYIPVYRFIKCVLMSVHSHICLIEWIWNHCNLYIALQRATTFQLSFICVPPHVFMCFAVPTCTNTVLRFNVNVIWHTRWCVVWRNGALTCCHGRRVLFCCCGYSHRSCNMGLFITPDAEQPWIIDWSWRSFSTEKLLTLTISFLFPHFRQWILHIVILLLCVIADLLATFIMLLLFKNSMYVFFMYFDSTFIFFHLIKLIC